MSARRSPIAIALILGASSLFIATSVAGCRDDLNGRVSNKCPNQTVFENSVSPYLERRCGTLDCHGGIARPMRLFGRLGLRHPDEDNIPGGKATTKVELGANYTSVCGIEPEKMNDTVVKLGNSADELLMIKKARGVEKHKGGKVVDEADHADNCMLGWLRLGEKPKPEDAAAVEAECAAAITALQ